jgi:N6-adenosine-specific RNA methylase IME4
MDPLVLGSHHKFFPKIAKKLNITIRNYTPRNAMQTYNLPKEQVCDMRCIICLMACNEM